jgi:hypothetical protein
MVWDVVIFFRQFIRRHFLCDHKYKWVNGRGIVADYLECLKCGKTNNGVWIDP